MDRRALLAAAAAALPTAVAGCVGVRTQDAVAEVPTARLEMEPVNDADLPGRVLYSAEDPSSERGKLAEAAVDGGTTVEATRPLVPEGREIAGPNGVYELSYEVVDRTPATAFSVKLDIVQGTVAEERAVQFADLPTVDRETFSEHGLEMGEIIGIGTTLLYTAEAVEKSELVPESDYDYITWENGNAAEWVVDDSYEQTLKAYRYAGMKVDSLAGYGERLREKFAFDLDSLSAAEQAVVEQAIGDQYVVPPEETPTPGLRSLVAVFRGKAEIRGLAEEPDGNPASASGRYLTCYNGTVYLTRLSYQVEQSSTTT